jgi:predicted regulator of Ras-like GTPase activity (Roadblock/LC7/MglB family)
MSNSVKNKFAGLFRGLFRRSEPAEDAAESRPVTASAPAAPVTADFSDQPVAPPDSPAVPPANNDDEIALPLAPIIASLPMELRAKIMSVPSPGQTISLPVETITAQLAFGAVKISFGELRRLAPGIFSNAAADQDAKTISLPLGEILSRMNPALLARRARKKVEVSDDINGPFAGRGNGVVFTVQPVKPAASAPKNNVATPAPAFTAPPPRMNQPAVSTPPLPSAPIAFATPAGFDRTQAPPTNGNGNGNGHHAPPPVPKISTAPIPAPTIPRPASAQPTIFVMISQLAEGWPDELKDEISTSGFSSLKVPLAGAEVEAGLKRGRVGMTWKQLRLLAKPGSPDSPNDLLELELPLKVIAPLFFAAQKNGLRAQKSTAVSEEIPNLFFGFPQPAPASVSAPKPVEKKTSDSNYYVRTETVAAQSGEESVYAPPSVPHTDFTSRQASPKEVVARAMALPGVAGVIVTLPDGLRVASETPAEFNADTLAAFIPQLFERMNQSAKELRMGALNNVSFTVGNVPWRIFRVNAVYLAAFGRAGESLPTAQLAALVGELDRKKQQ